MSDIITDTTEVVVIYGSGDSRASSYRIQRDEHLLMVLRYVEGNPKRAGLVGSAKEWTWSSHREMIGEKRNILLDEIPIELPGDWERYVDEPLTSKEIEKVRQSVIRQSPYGNSEWQMQVGKPTQPGVLRSAEGIVRPASLKRHGQ